MDKNHRATKKFRLQNCLLPSLTGRGQGVGLLGLLLTCTLLCSCGSDDADTGSTVVSGQWAAVEGEPSWQVDWQYDQARPDWQEPEASAFENWTVITVEIENDLKATTTNSDLLAVFIDDAVCGLASPAITLGGDEADDNTYLYIMKVYSNQTADAYQSVTLKYYSDSLHQVFTSYAEISFSRYDDITELVPSFISGSEKYPVSSVFQLLLSASEASGVQPAEGDLLAAFVGEECRGLSTITYALFSDPVWMEVYGKESDESITLKYYHAATSRVFTFARNFSMADSWEPVSLSF